MRKRTTHRSIIKMLFGLALALALGCNSEEKEQAEQRVADSISKIENMEKYRQEIAECNYDDAKEKALAKTKSLGFFYVADHPLVNETKETATCFIRYAYHVKLLSTYGDGSSEVGDKIFDLHLRYQKINGNFEYLGGYLIDPVRLTRRDLD